jgi:hypothetical protein
VPESVHRALAGSGRPLDPSLRSAATQRFGHDFTDVRVHTEARAAASAGDVGAAAYTVGRQIVFAPGRYDAHTSEGRRLLAHELVHVVQQSGTNAGASLVLGRHDDSYEKEADRLAPAILADSPAASPSSLSGSVSSGLEAARPFRSVRARSRGSSVASPTTRSSRRRHSAMR